MPFPNPTLDRLSDFSKKSFMNFRKREHEKAYPKAEDELLSPEHPQFGDLQKDLDFGQLKSKDYIDPSFDARFQKKLKTDRSHEQRRKKREREVKNLIQEKIHDAGQPDTEEQIIMKEDMLKNLTVRQQVMDRFMPELAEQRMMQLRSQKEKVKNRILSPIKRRSLIQGDSTADSLFKTAMFFITGAPEDAYGVDIGTVMEQMADKDFEQRMNERSQLMENYKMLSSEFGEEQTALNDFKKGLLEQLTKQLDYYNNVHVLEPEKKLKAAQLMQNIVERQRDIEEEESENLLKTAGVALKKERFDMQNKIDMEKLELAKLKVELFRKKLLQGGDALDMENKLSLIERRKGLIKKTDLDIKEIEGSRKIVLGTESHKNWFKDESGKAVSGELELKSTKAVKHLEDYQGHFTAAPQMYKSVKELYDYSVKNKGNISQLLVPKNLKLDYNPIKQVTEMYRRMKDRIDVTGGRISNQEQDMLDAMHTAAGWHTFFGTNGAKFKLGFDKFIDRLITDSENHLVDSPQRKRYIEQLKAAKELFGRE